jgi:hypothetical protein
MARKKFKEFTPREKAKKRPRRHTKRINKNKPKKKKYNRQGRGK